LDLESQKDLRERNHFTRTDKKMGFGVKRKNDPSQGGFEKLINDEHSRVLVS